MNCYILVLNRSEIPGPGYVRQVVVFKENDFRIKEADIYRIIGKFQYFGSNDFDTIELKRVKTRIRNID